MPHWKCKRPTKGPWSIEYDETDGFGAIIHDYEDGMVIYAEDVLQRRRVNPAGDPVRVSEKKKGNGQAHEWSLSCKLQEEIAIEIVVSQRLDCNLEIEGAWLAWPRECYRYAWGEPCCIQNIKIHNTWRQTKQAGL